MSTKFKDSTKQLDEVEQIKPTKLRLEDMTKEELIERVRFLENLDGQVGMFYAMNRKSNELARSLNNFEVDIESGGKAYDNFVKLQEKFDKFNDTLFSLKEKLGLSDEDIKSKVQKELNKPILEQITK